RSVSEHFIAVPETVGIAVGIRGIGPVLRFKGIDEPITVGVTTGGTFVDEGIVAEGVFPPVAEPIPVGIRIERVGAGRYDFFTVAQSIAVAVRYVRVGAVLELLAIGQSIPVRVGNRIGGIEWIESMFQF